MPASDLAVGDCPTPTRGAGIGGNRRWTSRWSEDQRDAACLGWQMGVNRSVGWNGDASTEPDERSAPPNPGAPAPGLLDRP